MVDLSSLSDADLEAIAGGADLSSLSDSALEAIANAPSPSDWTLGGSIKQGVYGAAEGVLNTVGMIGDIASPAKQINDIVSIFSSNAPKLPTPGGVMSDIIASSPLERDPKYRYARTAGNFIGGNAVIPGGMAPRSIFSALTGAVGAQGAEDLTGDTKVAPVIGGIFAGSLPSIFSSGYRALKGILGGATPAQIEGSAATALREQTGLTPEVISDAIEALPEDKLADLMTTAEVTNNAGMAQLEKTLGGQAGEFSNKYNARAVQREGARQRMLDAASDSKAVNKEGLGSSLIAAAEDTRSEMLDEAEKLWRKVPRHASVDVSPMQNDIASVIGERQGGLKLSSKVQQLVDQILPNEKAGQGTVKTSGALQDIRSDALGLSRDANLTPFDTRVLGSLVEGIDTSMERGLTGKSFSIWQDARNATRTEREIFGQSGAGRALVNESARPSNVLASAIKGDSQSIKEIKTAIRAGDNPALLEEVKRGFIDMVPTDASGKLTTNGMKKFIQQNDGAIKELLGEDHHANLSRILDDMRSQDSVAEMAGRASAKGPNTAQKLTVFGSVRDLVFRNVSPGTGKLASAINALESVAGKNSAKQVEDLLFRAAMDPRYAGILASKPTTEKVQTIVELLGGFLKETTIAAGRAGAVEIASRDQVLPEVQKERDAQRAAQSIFSNRSLANGSAVGSASLQNQSAPQAAPSQSPQGKEVSGLLSLGQPVQSQQVRFEPMSQSYDKPTPTPDATQDIFSTAINQIKSGSKADMSKENPTKFEARLIKSGVDIDQLDPIDLAQIKAESSGVHTIEGPQTKYGRAKGLMQLLDSTGKEWHKKLKLEGKYDPFDPYQNITIGKAYREYLVDRYDGDTRLGLAAFNWGLGNLDKLIARSKTGTYEEIRSKLPAETRNYVDKIMKEANGGMVTA